MSNTSVFPPALSWPYAQNARMLQNYDCESDALMSLYKKATLQQWSIDDLDWTHELDPNNPLRMPDPSLPIFGTTAWSRMGEIDRADVRRHFHGWTMSQILHGEQGAMLCAMKLAQSEDGAAARLCACAQAFDEARHMQAYSRVVDEKLRVAYPMSTALRGLLQDVVTSSHADITNLGMQVLVEGIALAIFQNVVSYSSDSFIKDLVSRVLRDEARHFAVGRLTLRALYKDQLTSAELAHREEFLCEALATLYDHLCATDVWIALESRAGDLSDAARDAPVSRTLRRSLFRQLVPAIRDIHLLQGKVKNLLESLSMLDYAHLRNTELLQAE